MWVISLGLLIGVCGGFGVGVGVSCYFSWDRFVSSFDTFYLWSNSIYSLRN